jgi:hypothetical protein
MIANARPTAVGYGQRRTKIIALTFHLKLPGLLR